MDAIVLGTQWVIAAASLGRIGAVIVRLGRAPASPPSVLAAEAAAWPTWRGCCGRCARHGKALSPGRQHSTRRTTESVPGRAVAIRGARARSSARRTRRLAGVQPRRNRPCAAIRASQRETSLPRVRARRRGLGSRHFRRSRLATLRARCAASRQLTVHRRTRGAGTSLDRPSGRVPTRASRPMIQRPTTGTGPDGLPGNVPPGGDVAQRSNSPRSARRACSSSDACTTRSATRDTTSCSRAGRPCVARVPAAQLVVAGLGNDVARLQDKARALGVGRTRRILWIPPGADVDALLGRVARLRDAQCAGGIWTRVSGGNAGRATPASGRRATRRVTSSSMVRRGSWWIEPIGSALSGAVITLLTDDGTDGRQWEKRAGGGSTLNSRSIGSRIVCAIS